MPRPEDASFPVASSVAGHALKEGIRLSITGHSPTDRIGKEAAVRLLRAVNDEIARIGATFQAEITSGFEFVCECGDPRCKGIVNMTLADYAKTTPGSVVDHD